jgi:LysM repeat protein
MFDHRMKERVVLFLRKRLLVSLLVLVSALIVTGIFMTESYLTHSKSGTTVEASTRLGNYTVKNGDSIFTIAGKYGVSIAALRQANVLNSGTVNQGQVLTIPDKPSTDWYTVESGDSLCYIATKYDVTVDDLQKANMLKSDLIIPGQVFIIPANKVSFNSKASAKPTVVKDNSSSQEQVLPKKVVNLPLAEIIREKGINDPWSRMAILINKSSHTLSLYIGGIWLKSYPLELGDGGLADKKVQGDHKTPEGTFYIAEKSVLEPADKFLGTRWLRLSYPNVEDAERGIRQGLIDQKTHDAIMTAWKNKDIPPQYTALGGGVGIHGGNSKEQGSNWTWGCIGLSNKDVEDIFNFVAVGTPIIIQK